MTQADFTDDELLAYLDEMLAVDRASAVEKSLRNSEALRQRLTELVRRRDQGVHAVGEIWRRMKLSCPSRSELGSYLLGVAEPAWSDYLEFHIQTVGCRFCEANLKDLQDALASTPQAEQRREKYFQSSAGFLSRLEEK